MLKEEPAPLSLSPAQSPVRSLGFLNGTIALRHV